MSITSTRRRHWSRAKFEVRKTQYIAIARYAFRTIVATCPRFRVGKAAFLCFLPLPSPPLWAARRRLSVTSSTRLWGTRRRVIGIHLVHTLVEKSPESSLKNSFGTRSTLRNSVCYQPNVSRLRILKDLSVYLDDVCSTTSQQLDHLYRQLVPPSCTSNSSTGCTWAWQAGAEAAENAGLPGYRGRGRYRRTSLFSTKEMDR